jgi:putative DNA primase/helicase
VGTSLTPARFKVYCAKVLAGIGVLPDTITDRSIPIRLQRKTKDEVVKRFRIRDVSKETEPIREALEAFAAKYGEAFGQARPDLPEELSDRMQEGCEPLIAIADTLGYSDEARDAMVKLLTAERSDEKESAQLKLLASVRQVFESNGSASAIFTADLTMALQLDGWGADNWYGRGINAQDLASMLRPYEIHPKQVRIGTETKKGYHRDDFVEAWTRYLPVSPVSPSTEEVG